MTVEIEARQALGYSSYGSTRADGLPQREHTGTVTFLGQVDGELESGLTMRGAVARCIRTVRPDVVLGHDPWKRYRLHPDHRHAGLLACEGIVAARDPHFFREHDLAPHRPETLLLCAASIILIGKAASWSSTSATMTTRRPGSSSIPMAASAASERASYSASSVSSAAANRSAVDGTTSARKYAARPARVVGT